MAIGRSHFLQFIAKPPLSDFLEDEAMDFPDKPILPLLTLRQIDIKKYIQFFIKQQRTKWSKRDECVFFTNE